MPRGSKAKYTDKQKRMAEHIEKGYERHGVPEDETERSRSAKKAAAARKRRRS